MDETREFAGERRMAEVAPRLHFERGVRGRWSMGALLLLAGCAAPGTAARAFPVEPPHVPSCRQRSVDRLGEYFRDVYPDAHARIRAMHDWIASTIAYDVSYSPAQDAATVLRRHTATCAGYANLLAALGERTGDDIVVVDGEVPNARGEPLGHAWNAVLLDGRWQFIDVTWDAGWVESGTYDAFGLPLHGRFIRSVSHQYFLASRSFEVDHDPGTWRAVPLEQTPLERLPAAYLDATIGSCGALGCPRVGGVK